MLNGTWQRAGGSRIYSTALARAAFIILFILITIYLGKNTAAYGVPIFGVVILAFLILAVFVNLKVGLFVIFGLYPVLAMFWETKIIPILGRATNPQQLFGVIVPFLFFLFLIIKKTDLFKYPLSKLLFAFFSINVFGFAFLIILLGPGFYVRIVANFFRLSGGWVFFFAVPLLIKSRKDVRNFLLICVVSLIAPIISLLLQRFGLITYSEFGFETGVELGFSGARATGAYYHPWDIIRYVIPGLILTLFFLSEKPKLSLKLFYLGYFGLLLYATYSSFLRYGYVVVGLIIILWNWLRGKKQTAFVIFAILTLVVIVNLTFFSALFEDVSPLFSEDVSQRETAISGRGYQYRADWDYYKSLPLAGILLGQRLIGRYAFIHNDYQRILIDNGLIGLFIYLLLLTSIGVWLIKQMRFFKKQGDEFFFKFTVGQICFLVAYVLAGFLSRPSEYPTFNWYLWAFMGLIYWGYKFYNKNSQNEK